MIKLFSYLLSLIIIFYFVAAIKSPVLAQQAPPTVAGVLIEFPNCVNEVCNFTEASCSWGATTGATQYRYVITRLETNTVDIDQTIASSTTTVSFPVVQNQTYKCDVYAINAQGQSSTVAGSHQLFCEVDALLEEIPTPTAVIPTKIPPPVPPSGGIEALPMMSAGIALLLSAAGVTMFLKR